MLEPAPPVHSLAPFCLPLSNQSMTSPPQDDPLPNLTYITTMTKELSQNNLYCHSLRSSAANPLEDKSQSIPITTFPTMPSTVNYLQDKSQSMPITTSRTSANTSSNPNDSYPLITPRH